jgi:hypothetical protein
MLVSVALFLVFGMVRFWMDIPQLFLGNVQQSDSFSTQVRLMDSFEGVVSIDTTLQPFKVFSLDRLEEVSFPLSYQLCLFAQVQDQSPTSLECWKRFANSLTDLQPLVEFSSSFFLPSTVAEYSFFARGTFEDSFGEVLGEMTTLPRVVRWIPETRLRLADGKQMEPGESVLSPDIVFFVSRSKDVLFSSDGNSISPSLIVQPKPLETFLPLESGSVSFHQWAYPISPSLRSAQLCSQSASAPAQCFMIESEPVSSQGDSLCGNGVVDVGEECDSPSDDSCTPQCILNDFPTRSFEYPHSSVSVLKTDDGRFSLLARLEPNTKATTSVDPRELFIRFETGEGFRGISTDDQRIDGYPFLKSVFPPDQFVTIEFFHLQNEVEYVFHTSLVHTSDPSLEVQELKSAADENPFLEEAIGDIGILQVKWLGSDVTEIDHLGKEVIDLGGRQDFSSRVVVQSTFQQSLKVTISFVDESISFTHTLAPGSSEEIPLFIPGFSYGNHRFVVSAVLPDGQKTADIVFPFLYRSESLVGGFAPLWQVIAIGILCMLGFSYGIFRIGSWKMRTREDR